MFEHELAKPAMTWRAHRRGQVSMARHGVKSGGPDELPPFGPVRADRGAEPKHRGGMGIFVTQDRGLIPT
jgi:hypothetical protein